MYEYEDRKDRLTETEEWREENWQVKQSLDEL